MSFVRQPEDLHELKRSIRAAGSEMPVIIKIEKPEALEHLDELIANTDAVLVARGDLGVETDIWRVPLVQKDIVARCRRAGVPVIVATQMLESMIESPMPTRAEVSDVANAVFDRADAVMLSGETAVGRFPVQAVDMMNRDRRRHGRIPGAGCEPRTWLARSWRCNGRRRRWHTRRSRRPWIVRCAGGCGLDGDGRDRATGGQAPACRCRSSG